MAFDGLSALLLCAFFAPLTDSAKILGIFPNFGRSQFFLGGKLMRELASRGHQVTVVSPYPSEVAIPNYRDISTAKLIGPLGDEDLFKTEADGAIKNILSVMELGLLLTEYTFETPAVKQLLSSNNETFDLVLCEHFFNEAHMGFAHHFKSPLILFSSLGPSEVSYDLTGNPIPYSYLPSIFSTFTDRMSLWQRLQNAFIVSFYRLYWYFHFIPKQRKLLEKYIPGSSADLHELLYGADLVLFNSHFSTHYPAPSVPKMVEIGGFHVDPKPLPKNLQEFLDGAEVVYMSMGSVLKGARFPSEKRDAILRAFAKLKLKVLWKWEEDEMPGGRPSNVKIAKWLPQQDVLAHSNVKVFISHCGLLSTIEATYHGVPMICIPIFGDQKMNAAVTEAFGSGIILPLGEITETRVTNALNTILTDSKYRDKAKLRSKLMRDRPLKPIDLAMYWVEYVIRNNGTRYLQTAGMKLCWYQYYMLDAAAIFILGVFLLIKTLFRKSTYDKSEKTKIN